MSYVNADYVNADYVEVAGAVDPTLPIIPTAPLHTAGATMLGSAGALRLSEATPSAQSSSPPLGWGRGPYGVEPIVSLYNHTGQYVFMQRIPPDELQADDCGRFATLLTVERVDINSVPLQGDVFGGVAASERPLIRATFDNADGWWSKLLASEAVLTMPMSLHLWFGGPDIFNFYQGAVQRVTLNSRTCSIEFGED